MIKPNNLLVKLLQLEEKNSFDILYFLCIASKQTCIIIFKMPITMTKDKLDKIYVDF